MKGLLIVLVAVFCVIGCNPVKKVLRKPAWTQEVVTEYLKRYPFKNDTIITKIPGDSIITFEILSDTITLRDSFNIPVERLATKYVTKMVTKTDTFKIREIDRTGIKELQDRLITTEIAKDQEAKEKVVERKLKNQWKTYFWLLLALMGGGIFLLLKFRR